jgi:hypothetical protein
MSRVNWSFRDVDRLVVPPPPEIANWLMMVSRGSASIALMKANVWP